ncbi:unnamed protein product, partial [Thelazia callipaeda]|uniref:Purine nucleoside phosphorylase n=1 Tax=Thelazia callipaeda TaxID=103827 RepID=A0A0N5CZS1_THECL
SPRNYEDLLKITQAIREQIELEEVPKIGIICGSGLSAIADCIKQAKYYYFIITNEVIKNLIVGHKGNLIFGYLGGKYVICVQGRFHPYEHGMDLALCSMPVRILNMLGVETLIVSNAAGGINSSYNLGDLMIIKDHICLPALAGFSPFVGQHDDRFGERFTSLHEAYSHKLRRLAVEVGIRQKLGIHEGVYAMNGGPQFESPAEIRMLKMMGADAVGMSTCHEVVVACQMKMRVLGFSLITNVFNLIAVKHEDVLKLGEIVEEQVSNFVAEIVKNL